MRTGIIFLLPCFALIDFCCRSGTANQGNKVRTCVEDEIIRFLRETINGR